MRKVYVVLISFSVIALQSSTLAIAQEAGQTCQVDTTKDSVTGQPRNGVQVCSGNGSASVGGSVSGKELENFAKYPIGQSDASVAKHIGNAVHHFFSHL
jgi:hypothetical protein